MAVRKSKPSSRTRQKKKVTRTAASRKSLKAKAAPKVKAIRIRTPAAKAPLKVKRTRVKIPRLTKAQQRDPRRVWTYLRKLGLIQSKRDARKIKKSDKRVVQTVERFRDVISGKSEVFRVSTADARRYKRAGYKVSRKNIILEKVKGTTRTKKKRYIHSRRKIKGGEIVTVLTPYDYVELQSGLDALEKDPEIKALLKKGWRFALKFYGNFSYATMHNVDALRDYLEHYSSIDAESTDVLQNLELIVVLVDKGFALPTGPERRALHNRRRRAYRREHGRSSYDPVKWQRWKTRNPGSYAEWKRRMRTINKKSQTKQRRKKAQRKRNAKKSKR